jgi:hypothetical protein
MAQLVLQMWQCLKCSSTRQWGMAVAPDIARMPWLYCEKCDKHTEHVFFRHVFDKDSRMSVD